METIEGLFEIIEELTAGRGIHITLIPQQRPLLRKCCFGTCIRRVWRTHLVAAKNTQGAVMREGEMSDRPSPENWIRFRAEEMTNKVISDDGRGAAWLVGGD